MLGLLQEKARRVQKELSSNKSKRLYSRNNVMVEGINEFITKVRPHFSITCSVNCSGTKYSTVLIHELDVKNDKLLAGTENIEALIS